MAIDDGRADCARVLAITDGAGGAGRRDGHHADDARREDAVMAIVKLSPKSGAEASR